MDYAKQMALQAAKAAEELLHNSHFADVDDILSTVGGMKVEQDLLEYIAKGADYSNLIYDLQKLCDNLDKDTELVVLSEEIKITNIGKSEVDKEQEQPDGK